MKSKERRQQLLEWLEQSGNLSLTEIVERFSVSKMTVHRDLELLEQRKALKRIHGGAVAVDRAAPAEGGVQRPTAVSQGACLVCSRPGSPQLAFTLTLKNGEQRTACCPHCGISACLVLGDQVATAVTSDYLSGRPHPVLESCFVLGSVAAPCCQPSMLTFVSEEMARRFQAGFGGTLGNYEAAVGYLQDSMTRHHHDDSCPHCAAFGLRQNEGD